MYGGCGKDTCIRAFVELKTRLGHVVSEDSYHTFFILTLSKVPSQTIELKLFFIVGILVRKNTKIAACVDYAFLDVCFNVTGKTDGFR